MCAAGTRRLTLISLDFKQSANHKKPFSTGQGVSFCRNRWDPFASWGHRTRHQRTIRQKCDYRVSNSLIGNTGICSSNVVVPKNSLRCLETRSFRMVDGISYRTSKPFARLRRCPLVTVRDAGVTGGHDTFMRKMLSEVLIESPEDAIDANV